MAEAASLPKAFVSYSWSNEEHIAWVDSLARRLMSNGVDIILDKWDLKEGQDKHVFMEQMATNPAIKKVLIICDKAYAEKADARRGGVGTEALIISQDIYEMAEQQKFIPIIREWNEDVEPKKAYVPTFLKGRKYIDFTNEDTIEDAFDQLIRNIHGRPEVVKPPLGSPPAHIFVEHTTHVKTIGKLEALKNAVLKGKPHVQPMLQDYFDTFIEALDDFRLPHKSNRETPFDEDVVASITRFLPYRDNFINFAMFFCQYLTDADSGDKLFEFLERLLAFKERPESMSPYNDTSFDNCRFIVYELFLYLMTVLIKQKRYEYAARLMESEYHYPTHDHPRGFRSETCSDFYAVVQSLDEVRRQRLRQNTYSVTTDIIVERANDPKIRYAQLAQIDHVLFIRKFFPFPNGGGYDWYPRLRFQSHFASTLELFARATTDAGMKALRQLLRVKDIKQLWDLLFSLRTNKDFVRLAQSERWMRSDWDTLLNMEAIRRAAEGKK